LKKILFITPIIPSYRVWLYKKLNLIPSWDFIAIHGREMNQTFPKDVGHITSFNNIIVKNYYLNLKGIPICFQMNMGQIYRLKPDIIVILDNIKIISNVFIYILSFFLDFKIIYYTHGLNNGEFTSQKGIVSKVTELLRSFFLRKSTAIIAYTSKVNDYLVGQKKICQEKIFTASNTLDTELLVTELRNVSNTDTEKLTKALDIEDKFVICFLGRLTPQKNIKLFIDVIKKLQNNYSVSGIIIGDGPLITWCKKYTNDNNITDIHIVGEKSGLELACYLKLAHLMFLPQHVGLAIVHSFIANIPFITGKATNHGPEIEYLMNGYNGILVNHPTIDNFAYEVGKLIINKSQLMEMSNAAFETAQNRCNSSQMIKAFKDAVDYSILN
jgi:glycosyltransferase involved in cell wall biosynthesis